MVLLLRLTFRLNGSESVKAILSKILTLGYSTFGSWVRVKIHNWLMVLLFNVNLPQNYLIIYIRKVDKYVKEVDKCVKIENFLRS